MSKHSIKIIIGKDGKAVISVDGLKGTACLDATRWLRENPALVVIQDEPTADFYAAEMEELTETESYLESDSAG